MPDPTLPHPRPEIVAPAPDRMAAARASKQLRAAERAAASMTFPRGVRVYPDTPPGVGWVLERPHKPNLYYATRELALSVYRLTLPKTSGKLWV